MAPLPKRRHSKARQGKRRGAISWQLLKLVACQNCKSLNPLHTICKNCGFYKGKSFLKEKTKITVKKVGDESKT